MKEPKKPRADSKLKNLPDNVQEGMWQLLNPADAETKAYTLEDLGGHVFDSHGISVGLATLSEWRSWYALKRRMEAAAERADQARLELAKDPNISPADIERVAQTVFTAETLQAGDVEGYVRLAKLGLQRRALEQDERKLALLEAKAKQADEARGVSENAKLTPEEKASELKRIFRMG